MKRGNEKNPQLAFGKAMQKYRHELGVSQEKFALMCGIHRTYIGSVERGERNISLRNMLQIAKTLGVPLSRLIVDMENG